MKFMYGAAIQGAPDYHVRRAVHRRIMLQIKAEGIGLVTEHTAATSSEDVAESLEESIGPLPPKEAGQKRTEYIRNKIIEAVEGDIDAAIYEVSLPSIGVGIELAHSYLRPKLGKTQIPILILYQEGYWNNRLSAMVRGLPFGELPNVEVHYYRDFQELDSIIKNFIERISSGALKTGLVSVSDPRPGIIADDVRKLFNPIGLFVSMVPRQRAVEILNWHKSNYAARQQIVGDNKIFMKYMGLDIEVEPDVFEPREVSKHLAKSIINEVMAKDKVLDMNCASGVNAILAASKSEHVEAVDVNPFAVRNTRKNAIRNGVGSRIKSYESDIFDMVEGKFDLIVTDPPFKWFKPRNMYERSITDENYEGMRRFISQAHKYLKPGGRILMLFSDSGDIEYVQYLIKYSGLKYKEVKKRKYALNGRRHMAYVLRLTLD